MNFTKDYHMSEWHRFITFMSVTEQKNINENLK